MTITKLLFCFYELAYPASLLSLGLFYLPPLTDGAEDSRACAYFRVVGLREGFTELEASYTAGDNAEEHQLTARYPIAVYKNIQFLTEDLVVAVAVGSSRRISVCNFD